jgi:hypothetical protein
LPCGFGILEIQPAQRTLAGAREIVLDEAIAHAAQSITVGPIELHKEAAAVAKGLRLDDQHPRNGGLTTFISRTGVRPRSTDKDIAQPSQAPPITNFQPAARRRIKLDAWSVHPAGVVATAYRYCNPQWPGFTTG